MTFNLCYLYYATNMHSGVESNNQKGMHPQGCMDSHSWGPCITVRDRSGCFHLMEDNVPTHSEVPLPSGTGTWLMLGHPTNRSCISTWIRLASRHSLLDHQLSNNPMRTDGVIIVWSMRVSTCQTLLELGGIHPTS